MRLSLNDLRRFVSDAHGNLSDAAAAVYRVSEAVAHDVALHCDEVLQLSAAGKPVHRLDILGKPVLHQAEPCARYLLSTFGQDSAGL